MLVTITYGLLEGRDSGGHGLAPLGSKIESFFGADVEILEWKDDLVGFITSQKSAKPLIMIGHSFGGGASVRAAQKLMQLEISVDLLILLDPVPPNHWLMPAVDEFVIPDNVIRSLCFHRNPWAPPWSRPIKRALNLFENREMNLGHSDFNGDPEVQEEILKLISWTEQNAPSSPAQ